MIPKIYRSNRGRSKNRIYYVMGVKHDHSYKSSNSYFIGSNCAATLNFGDIIYNTSKSANLLFNEIDTATKLRELEVGTRRKVSPVFHMSMSLAPGERLTKEQWHDAAKHMLTGLGFDLITNKYHVALHTDTDHHHIHITANKIKLEPGYPIVHIEKDRLLSCRLAGEIEDMFKLSKAPQPKQTWGTSISQKDAHAAEESGDLPKKFKLAGMVGGTVDYVSSVGGDMIHLVKALRRKDIYVHLNYDKDGHPNGISFEHGDSVFSGSELKPTRLTFNKLTTQEGIKYDKAKLQELQREIEIRRPGYAGRVEKGGRKPAAAYKGYYYFQFIPQSSRHNVLRIRIKKSAAHVRAEIAYKEAMEMAEALIALILLIFGLTYTLKGKKAKDSRDERSFPIFHPDQPPEKFLAPQFPGHDEFSIKKLIELKKHLQDQGLLEEPKGKVRTVEMDL